MFVALSITAFVLMQHTSSFQLRSAAYDHAGTLLKGCKFHWAQSVKCVSRNGNYVAADKLSHFEELVTQLTTTDSTDNLRTAANETVTRFPSCFNWLKWRMRCDIAGTRPLGNDMGKGF